MKAIRYGIHFTTLSVAAAIFWLLRSFYLPGFDFFHYALMGFLHATSIVVSLRNRRTVLHVISFIVLATILSAVTPFMGLWGSVIWARVGDILRGANLAADAIF